MTWLKWVVVISFKDISYGWESYIVFGFGFYFYIVQQKICVLYLYPSYLLILIYIIFSWGIYCLQDMKSCNKNLLEVKHTKHY